MFERLWPPRRTTCVDSSRGDCRCDVDVDGQTVSVEGTPCPNDGHLAENPACRSRVIEAVVSRSVTAIRTVEHGRGRDYRGAGPALVTAAARFATVLEADEPRLADRARWDPLGAAREAIHRAGQVATVAQETGLARFADGERRYETVFCPTHGPAISEWRVDPSPPMSGRLLDRRQLGTGAVVRVYGSPERTTRIYHLEPAEQRFDDETSQALSAAYEHLANAPPVGESATPVEAVRAVAGDGVSRAAVVRALRKHCYEGGLLRDLFADPALSDVFVTTPTRRNAIRVRVDGETLATNVTVSEDGVAALASRFRRESGRGFSRASPTLDAATSISERRVRVAGVTEPVSDGQAFAFRAHDSAAWTLRRLVSNGTVTPAAAGFLAVAVERGAAVLLAGPRGSGKTTSLGALLWELPASVRTVVIEDTPELPVEALQSRGRDVQALRTDDGTLSSVEALRAALRLGDGALVVGEVRGEEARALYEAMRVGANSEAVLGTIHGDGGEAVFERVVSDLGVPASSFVATDLVVTLETVPDRTQNRDGVPRRATAARRVCAIEEVRDGTADGFATLFEQAESGLAGTGRIDRGNSQFVASLAAAGETYADVHAAIQTRGSQFAEATAASESAAHGRSAGRQSGVD